MYEKNRLTRVSTTGIPLVYLEKEVADFRDQAFEDGFISDAAIAALQPGAFTVAKPVKPERIKVFEIERNPETWAKIVERVEECRKIISNNKKVVAYTKK